MTHRGPFQPPPFCDSVILSVPLHHVGKASVSSPPDAVRVQQPLEVPWEADGVGDEGGQLAPVGLLRGSLQHLAHLPQPRLGQGWKIHWLSSGQRQQLLPGVTWTLASPTAAGRAPHPLPMATLTRGFTSSSEVKDTMKEWAMVPRTGMP